MARRAEFSRRTKLKAWDAAEGRCARCGKKIGPGDGPHYDHIIPAELGGGNNVENCQVLCIPCHVAKTGGDVKKIAKSRSVRARHVGARRPKATIPGSRGTRWKRKLDGTVVPREEKEYDDNQ